MEKQEHTAVLITGAAGGVGHALVSMALTLPDIERVVAADISERITALYGDDEKVVPVVTDVSGEGALRQMRERLRHEGIRVKYLVNNAGIFFFHPVSELTQELFDRIVGVNTRAAVLTVSIFLDDLVALQGRVVQVSTCGVRFPTLFQPYPASKVAMEAFSISMRQELALLGVSLSLVRAGAIDTPLMREMGDLPMPHERSRYKEWYGRFLAMTGERVGRVVPPEAMARTVRKALTARRPQRLYVINRNPTIRWLSWLPQTWLDTLLERWVGR